MASVYRVTEIVGTSTRSWEDAAKRAVAAAGKALRELRVAEVSALDMTIEDGKVKTFRTKVNLSFKYDPEPVVAAAAEPAPKAAAKKKVVKKKTTKKKKVAKKRPAKKRASRKKAKRKKSRR